jgi:hypothetical protein
MAYGQMGMTEAEWHEANPEYWHHRVKGWRKQQFDTERAAWNRTRWMAAVLLQPWSKKSIAPLDLLIFPDELEDRRRETIAKAKAMRNDKRFPATLPPKIKDDEQSN